jgi:hypothetical protein
VKTEPICRVLLFGGLGNQLFQIAAAMHVANSQKILLDTSLIERKKNSNWFKEHKDFELGEHLMIEDSSSLNWLSSKIVGYAIRNSVHLIETDKKLFCTLLLRKITSNILSLFVFRNHEVHIANGLGYDVKLKSKQTNVLLIGYFQSYKWLKSDDDIINAIRNLIGCDLTKENDRDQTLLQIRLGDFVNSKDFFPVDTSYLKKAIKMIELKQSIRKIVVYSDDIEGAKLVLSEIEEGRLSFNEAITESVLSTLRSMTEFQNHIISSSTFGFWGAILANQSSNVVAPMPWFQDSIDPKDLIPPSWSRIAR